MEGCGFPRIVNACCLVLISILKQTQVIYARYTV